MTAAGPKVFVVDDDPSVRKGPRVPGARTVCRPVCLVLDVRMPGLTGLALQEALAAVGRRLSIVFVTGHVDVPMSVEAMKGGAVDLLTKPSTTRVVAPVGDVGDDSRTGGTIQWRQTHRRSCVTADEASRRNSSAARTSD